MKDTLFCDLLNNVTSHFKIHEVVKVTAWLADEMRAHLHQLGVAEVGKAPRVVGIKTAGETGV